MLNLRSEKVGKKGRSGLDEELAERSAMLRFSMSFLCRQWTLFLHGGSVVIR